MADQSGFRDRLSIFILRFEQHSLKRPFIFYTLPLLAWAGFIAWGSLAPPTELPKLHIPLADKIEHTLAYALLGFLLLRGWRRERRRTARHLVTVVGLCALWGFYIEVLQYLTPYRSFEPADLAADVIGAVAGVLVTCILSPHKSKNIGGGTPEISV